MSVDREADLQLLQTMAIIRATEEEICARYAERNIRGAVHLSIGQEGAAAGVLRNCNVDDLVVSTHRNHAHYLAKGGSLAGLVDELFGLPSGCSHGYGGSMHLAAPAVGFVGASAVLPGSVPIAVGLGFAARHRGTGGIAVGFTGDGASDEGTFYEALNLAATLGLPVLFVCENNHLSTNTGLAERQAQSDLRAKAAAFGITSERVDGRDVVAVSEASAALIATVREAQAPAFLEIDLARLCAHVGPVSAVPPIHGEQMLAAARAGDHTDDPIVRLLGVLANAAPALVPDALAILSRSVEEVRAEFDRGNRAFHAFNESRQLLAPPPPKSYAV